MLTLRLKGNKLIIEMKKLYLIIIAIVLLMVLAGGYLWYRQSKNKSTAGSQSSSTESTAGNSSNNGASNSGQSASTPSVTPAPQIVYPISRFTERLKKNFFGSFFSSGSPQTLDRQVCPGATIYTGYHTGDDLETFADEQNVLLPVVSIADGRVLEANRVSGYGGLIVISYQLAGKDYTAYFGHVDLSTAKVKVGDTVVPGEQLADLAPACSSANDNVRKHLHFALHRGTGVDVHGYVATSNALSSWVDPAAILLSLGAK